MNYVFVLSKSYLLKQIKIDKNQIITNYIKKTMLLPNTISLKLY